MINSTFSLTMLTIQETHDKQGVKIAYGDCSFPSYSKDGLVENTVPFRAKGSAAVIIASLDSQSLGVATGYPDLEVKDNGNGYKEKRCVLVIRDFIPTNPLTEDHQTQMTAEPAMTVAVTTASQESTVDISQIPF